MQLIHQLVADKDIRLSEFQPALLVEALLEIASAARLPNGPLLELSTVQAAAATLELLVQRSTTQCTPQQNMSSVADKHDAWQATATGLVSHNAHNNSKMVNVHGHSLIHDDVKHSPGLHVAAPVNIERTISSGEKSPKPCLVRTGSSRQPSRSPSIRRVTFAEAPEKHQSTTTEANRVQVATSSSIACHRPHASSLLGHADAAHAAEETPGSQQHNAMNGHTEHSSSSKAVGTPPVLTDSSTQYSRGPSEVVNSGSRRSSIKNVLPHILEWLEAAEHQGAGAEVNALVAKLWDAVQPDDNDAADKADGQDDGQALVQLVSALVESVSRRNSTSCTGAVRASAPASRLSNITSAAAAQPSNTAACHQADDVHRSAGKIHPDNDVLAAVTALSDMVQQAKQQEGNHNLPRLRTPVSALQHGSHGSSSKQDGGWHHTYDTSDDKAPNRCDTEESSIECHAGSTADILTGSSAGSRSFKRSSSSKNARSLMKSDSQNSTASSLLSETGKEMWPAAALAKVLHSQDEVDEKEHGGGHEHDADEHTRIPDEKQPSNHRAWQAGHEEVSRKPDSKVLDCTCGRCCDSAVAVLQAVHSVSCSLHLTAGGLGDFWHLLLTFGSCSICLVLLSNTMYMLALQAAVASPEPELQDAFHPYVTTLMEVALCYSSYCIQPSASAGASNLGPAWSHLRCQSPPPSSPTARAATAAAFNIRMPGISFLTSSMADASPTTGQDNIPVASTTAQKDLRHGSHSSPSRRGRYQSTAECQSSAAGSVALDGHDELVLQISLQLLRAAQLLCRDAR